MALTFEGAQSSVNLAIYVDRKFFNRHQRHLGCIYLGVDGSHYFSGKESDFFPGELEQIKQKLSELNAR